MPDDGYYVTEHCWRLDRSAEFFQENCGMTPNRNVDIPHTSGQQHSTEELTAAPARLIAVRALQTAACDGREESSE